MSSYYWCHGPSCHTYSTQDRVRGTKGSKVLRTRKIKQDTEREWYDVNHASNYFCSTGCQNDFWRVHGNAIRQIAPRHEPLETPIEVREETQVTRWDGHEYKTKVIDKLSNVG
jgi:hypothetical protein